MKEYLIYSTIFCVFASDNIYYTLGFQNIDFRLYYIIFFINYLILIVKSKFSFNSKQIIFLSILVISGFIGYLRYPIILQRYLMAVWGVTYVSMYYYAFYKYANTGYAYLFQKYLKGALFAALYGYATYIYYTFFLGQNFRFCSFATEPSVYATLILPAFHYYLKDCLEKRRISIRFLLIFISIILSFSSLGYIGFGFSFLLLSHRIRFYKLAPSILIVGFFFNYLYENTEMFSTRAGSAFDIIEEKNDLKNVKGLNPSSFYLLSNFFVAVESAKETYGFGNGFGSHYNTYLRKIEDVISIEKLGDDFLQSPFDACSLFNRVLSDLGIWGVFLLLYFILKFWIKEKGERQNISRAILVTLLCRLVRDGRYFNADLIFFIMGYIFLYFEQEYDNKKKSFG